MPLGQFDPNAPVRPNPAGGDQIRQAMATARAARPASPYDKGAAPINLSKPAAPMSGGVFGMQAGNRMGVTPPWPQTKAALATGAAPGLAGIGAPRPPVAEPGLGGAMRRSR